jgi:hypothetical protein
MTYRKRSSIIVETIATLMRDASTLARLARAALYSSYIVSFVQGTKRLQKEYHPVLLFPSGDAFALKIYFSFISI